MTLHSFTHVALRVERLRDAEAFYSDLFRLDVAWREAETPEGWATLPEPAGWDEADRAGIELEVVMLYRDGLRLALEGVDSAAENGLLAHVGVYADSQELDRLREVAPASNCIVVTNKDRALVFDDPFGVRWELNTFDYEDPPRMSNGVRWGRWLDLTPGTGET
jgi:catechol 2,3-dioxygenase-like lactoylglutathione lyase family enzyme